MKSYISHHMEGDDLVLTASNEARHDFAEMLREKGSDHVFWEVIAPFRENGTLFPVRPETIAALTDAPIITDDLSVEDNGTTVVHGKVWWFPRYMITDPMAELAHKGRVVFTYGG